MTLREYVYMAEQQTVGMKIPVAQKDIALETEVVLQKKKKGLDEAFWSSLYW